MAFTAVLMALPASPSACRRHMMQSYPSSLPSDSPQEWEPQKERLWSLN